MNLYQPAPTPDALSGFQDGVFVLLLAGLLCALLSTLWERSRHRSRLPAAILAVGLLCSCTSLGRPPASKYGTWRSAPGDEPAEVSIWRDGSAYLRLDNEVITLSR